jgi:glycosyltransferase involved in cell wall biosynthesis
VRIAHVIHAFPPFSRAGSENYVEALARAQVGRHEVVVFHRTADGTRPEYEVTEGAYDGIAVVRVNRTFRDLDGFEGTYASEPVAAAFGAFLDREKPELVHFHHTTCLSTTCVGEAARRGIAVIYTLHDFWLLCPRGQLLRRDLSLCTRHQDTDCVRCMAYELPIEGGHERVRELDRRAARLARLPLPRELYRRLASRPFAREGAALSRIRERTAHVLEACAAVDRFVSPSQFLKERYVAFGVPGDKITVSDYGFDRARWCDRVRKPRAPGAPLRVAYLGTWIPSKGVHVLLEAFRGIDPGRAMLDVHGYAAPYAGFDDYEGHLKALAGGCPQIRLRGPYEPDDVPAILAPVDLLVVPSIWYENSPLTIHEAFLAGVPVLVSGHGGMAELVEDGVNGLTFRPSDPRSLRARLEALLDDPRRLEQLRAARPAVKDIEANARELEEIYRELRS